MLGIDFGTSTTIAACRSDDKVQMLRSAAGDEVSPSFVAFVPDGKVLVGRDARARRLIDPSNTLFSFKRILGRNWMSSEVRAFCKQYPFKLESGGDNMPRFVTRAGKLNAVELTAYLLAHLRESPQLAGKLPSGVTMTVPVSFKREARAAVVAAAIHAGWRAVELIEEPTAAATACLQGDAREQAVAVYDLGGGTFDFTIVHSHRGTLKVLASGGDSYLGGDDITARCANYVVDQVLEQYHWNIRSSELSYDRLMFACEAAKVALSFADQHEIALTGVDEILKDKTITLRRAQLDKLCLELIGRTFLICDEVMRAAGLSTGKLHAVALSGGCCYMPVVRDSVRKYFGQEPKMQLPPDKVVAMGECGRRLYQFG